GRAGRHREQRRHRRDPRRPGGLHPDGAYARGGVTGEALAALPGRLAPVVEAARAAGIPTVATLFTVATGPAGTRLVAPHLAELRPFLVTDGFEAGSWGQAVVDELGAPDVAVEKVAFSAFHASRLDHVLSAMGVETLVAAGIVTNGGVASTVRDAQVHGYRTVVVSDGCAAFDPAVHDATLVSLGSIAELATCAEIAASLTADR
ncbi:MAG: isochorismatase family cysteine hydrolase, partial [Actinomycetota bacterium]